MVEGQPHALVILRVQLIHYFKSIRRYEVLDAPQLIGFVRIVQRVRLQLSSIRLAYGLRLQLLLGLWLADLEVQRCGSIIIP